jgi:hypothetical protein
MILPDPHEFVLYVTFGYTAVMIAALLYAGLYPSLGIEYRKRFFLGSSVDSEGA